MAIGFGYLGVLDTNLKKRIMCVIAGVQFFFFAVLEFVGMNYSYWSPFYLTFKIICLVAIGVLSWKYRRSRRVANASTASEGCSKEINGV